MGITKANLQIDRLKFDKQHGQMGIEFEFNQPISLNSNMEPMPNLFITLKEICEIFQQLRKD